MKMKLVDETIHEITRADIMKGHLEIDIEDKTAEEMQSLFSVPANLEVIRLMTDEEGVFGELSGWTVYGGVLMKGETKTVILTKPVDITEERLTVAESNALAAKNKADETISEMKNTKEDLKKANTQITDIQMAICEIYEGMGV